MNTSSTALLLGTSGEQCDYIMEHFNMWLMCVCMNQSTCIYLLAGHTVAHLEVFFISDHLGVMSPFLCIIIMCLFDLLLSL